MAFGGAFTIDGFGIAFSEISIAATLLSLLLTAGVGRDDQVGGTTALMLWSACGAMLMAGAANLLMVFLGSNCSRSRCTVYVRWPRARAPANRRSSI